MISCLKISPLLSEEQCKEIVRAEDLAFVAQFPAKSRREEILTWRALLYKKLAERVVIEYDQNGAPYILGSTLNIGVSHTKGCVAIVISDSPCAVDIENSGRDLSYAATRFITPQENKLLSIPHALTIIWCAKECYYKLCRDTSLNIFTDIVVTSIDLQQNRVTVVDSKGRNTTLSITFYDEYIVVYLA